MKYGPSPVDQKLHRESVYGKSFIKNCK